MAKQLVRRFQELINQATEVEATARPYRDTKYVVVDKDLLLNWTVKVKSLISNACGIDSQHFMHLTQAERRSGIPSNIDNLKGMKAVLLASQEDFEGGYLISVRNLVQAEVFGSELEQASELLAKGYHQAAAVIAGCVLETGLQELCKRSNVVAGKIEAMNVGLVGKGVYNVLRQKQITALADLRNKAAHGMTKDFKVSDVESMIPEVQRILSDLL